MPKIAVMKLAGIAGAGLLCFFTLVGCNEEATNDKPKDTMISGTIDISVDETYQPVINEQLKVFDSSFPDAHINVHYKPESECLEDFMSGKAKLILVTRDLLPEEKKSLEDNKVVTTSMAIAKDAIAVIINNGNSDTVFSRAKIEGILTGEYLAKQYTVVFDNQGSSTLRYMLDSLIPGRKLSPKVYAAKGNDSVIRYVAEHPGAVGFISVSHVSDYDDPEGIAFINDVKVAAVYNDSLEKTYKPYQAYIAPEWYPLTRRLYYIHGDTYGGLAAGFAKFLAKDRGQLIFKQSRLFPTKVNIIFRGAEIKQ